MLSSEMKETLLDHLAEAIETHGWERFVTRPILEPSDRFFPDAYRDGPHGIYAVARRLMHYAGLGDVALDVVGTAEVEDELSACTISLVEASPREVVFEVEEPGAAEDVPLVLAHEVARAFVTLHAKKQDAHPYRAVRPDDAEDAHDTRVAMASLVLGFGLLAAKGAHQYRASGDMVGQMTRTRWIHLAVGSLLPDQATYLLAVQAAVRGVDSATRKRWRRHLSTNQRADLKSFSEALRGEGPALAERLGLPPAASWPPAVETDPEPFEDDGWEPEEVQVEEPPAPPVLRGSRHRGTAAVALATAPSAVGVVFAGTVGMGALVPAIAGAAVAMALAYVGGRAWWRVSLCTACEARLDEGADTCAGCGGVVVGELRPGETVHEAHDRLGFSAFGTLAAPQPDADPRYVELGVKCPTCAWIPDGEDNWVCDSCPATFDTFEHGGRCPACDEEFEETWCPACEAIGPYAWWWPEEA